MPRRPKTQPRRVPRQQRAEDTIEVLLEATERVFARDGFRAATTNRIAEVAGVSIGTLYHYFPTKEALIEAIVHRMWSREAALVTERRELLLTVPIEDAIRALAGALVTLVAGRRELYMRWYAEAPHLGQLDFGLDLTEQGIALVKHLLERERARAPERVRPADLGFAADFTVKMVLAAVRTAARDYPAQLASGELEAELCAMLLAYLLVPAAPVVPSAPATSPRAGSTRGASPRGSRPPRSPRG